MPTPFIPDPAIKALENRFDACLASVGTPTDTEQKTPLEKFNRGEYSLTIKSKQNLLLYNFYPLLIGIIEISQHAEKSQNQDNIYIDNAVKQLHDCFSAIQEDPDTLNYLLKEQTGRDALYYILIINMIFVSPNKEMCKKIVAFLLQDTSSCSIEYHALTHLKFILQSPSNNTSGCEEPAGTQQTNPFTQIHLFCVKNTKIYNPNELNKIDSTHYKGLNLLIDVIQINNACALFERMTAHLENISSFLNEVKELADKNFLPKIMSEVQGNTLYDIFHYIQKLSEYIYSFRMRHKLRFKSGISLLGLQYIALLQLSIIIFGKIKLKIDLATLVAKQLKGVTQFLDKDALFSAPPNEFTSFWTGIIKINIYKPVAEEKKPDGVKNKALLAALEFMSDFSMENKDLSPADSHEEFKGFLNTLSDEKYNFDGLNIMFLQSEYPEIINEIQIKLISCVQLVKKNMEYFSIQLAELINLFQKKCLKLGAAIGFNVLNLGIFKHMLSLKANISIEKQIIIPVLKKEEKKETPAKATFKPHKQLIAAETSLKSFLDALDENIRNLRSTPLDLKEYKRDKSLVDELDESNELLLNIIEKVIAIIQESQDKKKPSFNEITSNDLVLTGLTCSLQKLLSILFTKHKNLWDQFMLRPIARHALCYVIFTDIIHLKDAGDTLDWVKYFLNDAMNKDEREILEFIGLMAGSNKKELESYSADSITFMKNKILKCFLILKYYDESNNIIMNELVQLLKTELPASPRIPSFITQFIQLYFSSLLLMIMNLHTDDAKPLLFLIKKLEAKNYILKNQFTSGFSHDNLESYIFLSVYRFYKYANVFKENYTVSKRYIFNFFDDISNSALVMNIFYIHTLANLGEIKPVILKDLVSGVLHYLRTDDFDFQGDVHIHFWPSIIRLFAHKAANPHFLEELTNHTIDILFARNKEKEAKMLLESFITDTTRTYHDDLWWLISFINKLPETYKNPICNMSFLKYLEAQDKEYSKNHVDKIDCVLLDNFKHAKKYLLIKITKKMDILLDNSLYFKESFLNDIKISPLIEIILRLSKKLGMDIITWDSYKDKFIEFYDCVDFISFDGTTVTESSTSPLEIDIEKINFLPGNEEKAMIPPPTQPEEKLNISNDNHSNIALPSPSFFHTSYHSDRKTIEAVRSISDSKLESTANEAVNPHPHGTEVAEETKEDEKTVKSEITHVRKLVSPPVMAFRSYLLFAHKKNYSVIVKRERLPTALLNFSALIHTLTGQYLTIIGGAAKAFMRKKDKFINDYDCVLFFGREELANLLKTENKTMQFYFETRGSFPILYAILVEECLCECDLIHLPFSTKTNFLDFPTQSPAAYIRTKNNLYYVDKINKIFKEIKFDENLPTTARVNINMLKAFNKGMITKTNIRTLTLPELRHITTLTRHAHAKLIDVDISFYPHQEKLFEYMMKQITKQRDLKRSTLFLHLKPNKEMFIIKGFNGAIASVDNDLISAVNSETLFKNPIDILRIFRIAKEKLDAPECNYDQDLIRTLYSTNLNGLFNKFIFNCTTGSQKENEENVTHLRQINTQLNELFSRFNAASALKVLCELQVITCMTGIIDYQPLLDTATELAEYMDTLPKAEKINGFYLFIAMHYNLSPDRHHKKSLLDKAKLTLEPTVEAPEFQKHINCINKNTSTRMQPKTAPFTPDPEFYNLIIDVKIKVKNYHLSKKESKSITDPRSCTLIPRNYSP